MYDGRDVYGRGFVKNGRNLVHYGQSRLDCGRCFVNCGRGLVNYGSGFVNWHDSVNCGRGFVDCGRGHVCWRRGQYANDVAGWGSSWSCDVLAGREVASCGGGRAGCRDSR